MRILRGLGSRLLTCGCQIGIYEAYDGRSIAIVDAPGPHCDDPGHRLNAVLDLNAVQVPRVHLASAGEAAPQPAKPRH